MARNRAAIVVSPEAHFIALCAREPDAVHGHAIPSAAAAVRDWDAVVTTAAPHGVTAFVRQAAVRDAIRLPERADRALRRAALVALTQVMRLDSELARAVGALAAAAVPVIVLKGPVLARTIYPAATLRPYGDIDLSVQERHEDAAATALLGCGFAEIAHGPEIARRAHAGHVHQGAAYHRKFVAGDGEALVELHTDPLQLGLKPSCERGRWQRATPVPYLPGALMLCPEDQLVQLGVHAHKHGYNRLIWLKDLDLLLRAHGGLDWDLVAQVARREGVTASVWYSLHLASEVLRAPVPHSVLARLSPAPPLRALYGRVWPTSRIANLDGHMRRRAVQFHAADSWRGMLPNLVLMGRRHIRARAILRAVLQR